MKRITATALIGMFVAVGLMMAPTNTNAQSDTRIVIDGSTTVGPIAKAFAEAYMRANPGVNITVSESGSGNGAKSLINDACHIADMSRFMKPTEFKAAADNGIMPVAHVVALDGLPVLVHPSNPVKGLTLQQVHDIYTGEITSWNQVGGPDRSIVVVSRDTNSGTYETFEKLVMGGDNMGGGVEYVGSNGAVRQRVQSTPNAIGYAGLGFVDRSVKALEIEGIYPSAKTVTTGTYPIARPLFMFTDGYPKMGSHLYQFVTYYLTEEGQRIIEGIGFVPVTSYGN
ncbi:MAG: phosphate ABC transporter substrate-binding protein [bacterium]